MSHKELKDDELIALVESKEGLSRCYLYPELSKRADNDTIKEILFKDIVDETKRQIELSPRGSFIKLAWIPILEILLNSRTEIKEELKPLLKTWTDKELEDLRFYLKNNPEELKYLS